MNTNATTLGVEAVNKVRQGQVEDKAVRIINQILDNQKSIAAYQKSIEANQAGIRELSLDVVSQTSVIGAEFSTPLNANQVTIANAIKKINDARQSGVELKSQVFVNRIEADRAQIAAFEKSNSELRKALAELAVDVVTVESISGSAQ